MAFHPSMLMPAIEANEMAQKKEPLLSVRKDAGGPQTYSDMARLSAGELKSSFNDSDCP